MSSIEIHFDDKKCLKSQRSGETTLYKPCEYMSHNSIQQSRIRSGVELGDNVPMFSNLRTYIGGLMSGNEVLLPMRYRRQ